MDEMKSTRYYLLLLVCVLAPLFGLGLSNHGLWTADEPRVAEIGREMGMTGDWAVPTLNGKPFLEEPPLYYAALGATFRTLGVSDAVARIPSALFTFAGVIALFFLVAMFLNPRVGFLSGLIMATGGEYFRVAHWVIVDSALAFFVIAAVTCFAAAYRSQDGKARLLFYLLCYLSCTLAFFTKGFIGVVFPGLTVLSFLLFRRNAREILRMHLWLGVLLFLFLVLPWFLALWRQGGAEFLETFLIHNHVGRFAGGSSGHHQPFYYYLTQFPAGFLPWSILIIPVLYRAFGSGEWGDDGERAVLLLAKCWFIAGFLFLSVASTKRVLYLMPIFAPASLMTGWYIDKALREMKTARWEGVFARIFGVLPILAAVGITVFYFGFGHRYGLRPSATANASIGLFGGISIVLGAWALLSAPSAGKFWLLSTASVYSLLLLGLVGIFPLLDQFKSFVPFCRDIERIVPTGTTLYAYRPDETLRGAVPFYTGRRLQEAETTEELLRASEKGAVFAVIRDRKSEQERDLLLTGRFSVVSRRGDADRSLVIMKSDGR
jgi:4-amino-4-deoxy-L-arabinose transferase-like glycosyltransferase